MFLMDDLARTLALRTYEASRKFVVLSRSLIEEYTPDDPYIVVSVTDPKLPEAALCDSPHCRGVLRLQFHDTGDYGQPLRDNVVMTDADAQAILAFVGAHGDAATIVCQCEAGMSRSAGIAAALSRIAHGDDRWFFANFAPNRWVYRTIIDVHERSQQRHSKNDDDRFDPAL
jgi:predicted protein tyrosine phosphatase